MKNRPGNKLVGWDEFYSTQQIGGDPMFGDLASNKDTVLKQIQSIRSEMLNTQLMEIGKDKEKN